MRKIKDGDGSCDAKSPAAGRVGGGGGGGGGGGKVGEPENLGAVKPAKMASEPEASKECKREH